MKKYLLVLLVALVACVAVTNVSRAECDTDPGDADHVE